jgi:putative DNA methylase
VALPLEAINEASAREKSIRHGHPSTLHLWWARRPLAAARAVIFSSLVDDPSAHPELFPTDVAQDNERQRLFNLIEKLIVWENSNNETVLDAARKEIMKSTGGNPPALLDPFAGGGSIPLEAQRLGLETYANDLNPVAVMINKAMIEIPPIFGGQSPVNSNSRSILNQDSWSGTAGLAADVRYYGEWMKQEALNRIGHLYPKMNVPLDQGGGEATVIAWIWARTVKCPNPVCGCEMPLVRSFELSKKKGNEYYIEPTVRVKAITYSVKKGKKAPEGTVNRKGAKCISCGSPVGFPYIREEGRQGHMGNKLIAIVCEGNKGRLFISADSTNEILANVPKPIGFPDAKLPTNPRDFKTPNYGLINFSDLFTNRQITALITFSSLVVEGQRMAESDAIAAGLPDDHISLDDGGIGATAYGQAVAVYLSFIVDRLVDRSSSICSWDVGYVKIRNTFGRQAIPMTWDYAEGNPFSQSTGSFGSMITWVEKCLISFSTQKKGFAKQFDAQSDNGLRNIMVSTDPPYYDNIGYADLSDFFYIWMRQALKDTFPKLFRTMLVPKSEELVATPYRFDGSIEKARDFFEDGMLKTFSQVYQYARADIPVTIYYAFKQTDSEEDDGGSTQTASTGWETMLSAIIKSGFLITGTWPIRTEMANRSIGIDSNALASSIVIVCRKRETNATICTRRELIKALKRELKPALQELQHSNVAPVDLAQSAIGPGMAVFSRFTKVIESDGTTMSVRSALQIINQELDLYFSEQEGDLDRNSRFCVDLYSQYAFNILRFGEADVLARAKNTSVDRLVSEGAVFAQKGTVRLLSREEIALSINANQDFIWLLTQHLTHALETGGITTCAQIISMIMDSSAENAKNLAYRLFTIAERKKWAEEAYAYNSLVVAWPDVIAKAAELKSTRPEQMSLDEI